MSEKRKKLSTFDSMEKYLEEIEALADELMATTFPEGPSWNTETCYLHALSNVFITPREVIVTADLPNVEPETVKVEVTDENFKHAVGSANGLVLLDFWAEWCFACLELNPVLEEIAPEYQGRIKICKIEVDENPVLVEKYVPDLMFPCLVIMKDGKVLDRKYRVDANLEPKDFFQDWFSKFLSTRQE